MRHNIERLQGSVFSVLAASPNNMIVPQTGVKIESSRLRWRIVCRDYSFNQ